ncbi:serine/threonine-protein kinase [Coleofasciculus sp. FACHB-1120]|uniref:serine/threonine protein kinase n=1 Tax=Coleofasciculus sp. FACHB-1120 TaxID=2692783 RepID=UPI0016896575|nr:serine/threonine-protein kinase [Coleofasciculus sp. FACHB-1120]MBD2741662.1 serine/threonine protein kinase [Coleofasciculus sp. FACHB-1120]
MNGEVLGDRYQIEQQLGKRAGRRTLLARDEETQQLVIIKVLTFGGDFEWEHLKLFEREAETLKSLAHPAIPRYLDFFEVNSPNSKGFALVQTYIEAKSLEEHLKGGRSFSEAEIKQLATSILEILIYLHGRQPAVIHRDIKPSNILLTNRTGNSIGEVYLVDFGSVQTLAAKEGGTITVVGTYGYMPPEQFGDRAVPSSDLYSLGATLITLVTGTHPADLPHKDGRIQFEQAANLSPTLSSWLRWMTEPSLERRLASAQEALLALEEEYLTVDSAAVAVRKPTGSKVLLINNADFIGIQIPPKGFTSEIRQLCFFAIAWNSFIFVWTSSVLFAASGFNLFMVLFSLPFWYAGVSMIWQILFALFGRVYLRIDRQQISLAYELLGLKFNFSRLAQRQDISMLEHTRKYLTTGARGRQVEVKPRVIIWAGTQNYELASGELVTEPELDWIAYELSQWLRLPITRPITTEQLPPNDR